MPKQSFTDLTEEQARRIRQAFLDAIYTARNRAQISAIAEALARGDIEAVIRALALDPVVFRGLEQAIEQAFEIGGNWQIDRLLPRTTATGARVDILFNVRAYGAENWLRSHSSTLVREIVEDQRVAARNFLTAGMEAGANPKTTALDLVGRLNRTTGRREGGVLGLTSSQEVAVRRYAVELSDPTLIRQALVRGIDKTSAKIIRGAVARGEALDQSVIGKLVLRYRNKSLQTRGRTIARTETLASMHQASYEAMRQAIDAGQVDRDLVTAKWKTAKDMRVRDTHRALDGKEVPFGEAFVTPRGNRLRWPGDPSGGPSEVINCRCNLQYRIDYFRQAARDAREEEADTPAALQAKLLASATSKYDDERVVNVDLRAVDRLWAETDLYIGPDTESTFKLNRATEFLRKLKPGEEWYAPQLGVGPDFLGFTDGRHRFAAMRELGLNVAPVAMDVWSIENARLRGLLVELARVS